MDTTWLPIHKDWRLNERHYGALTGLTHSEATRHMGEEQILKWRRGFDVQPPAISEDNQHQRTIVADRRYREISIPSTESSHNTLRRLLPYWGLAVVSRLTRGQNTLMVGHGNVFRGLIGYIDGENMHAPNFQDILVPNGVPIIYRLTRDLQIVEKRVLS